MHFFTLIFIIVVTFRQLRTTEFHKNKNNLIILLDRIYFQYTVYLLCVSFKVWYLV